MTTNVGIGSGYVRFRMQQLTNCNGFQRGGSSLPVCARIAGLRPIEGLVILTHVRG